MKKSIIIILLSILVLLGISMKLGFITSSADETSAPLFYSYDDFEVLGIEENTVALWEDGLRTNGKEDSFEWWYTDAEFHDGTTVVVVFYTKDGFDISGPAHPKATIEITYADGRKVHRELYDKKGKLIDASKELCDVNIQNSYLKYVDGDYHLNFEDGDLKYNVVMKSEIPMWRPGTGHTFYDNNREDYFAWVVAQPSSLIEGTLEINGSVTKLKGEGYHDHNWGNIEMNKVVEHWYWGRAKVGDYNIITSDLVTADAYGNYRLPVIMIANKGKIIPVPMEETSVKRKDHTEHDKTGKFMDNQIIFTQPASDGKVYTIEYDREEDIVVASLLDNLPWYKRILAKLVGANPTYVRIKGTVNITIDDHGKITKYSSDGLWEQMSFGNKKIVHINEYKGPTK